MHGVITMTRLAALFAFALFLLLQTSIAAAECQFVLGFKTLRDLIGHEIVGECLENEHHGANGDALQQTTGGLLVWRKADNWTAFTDGYRTWINGPNGLVQRLNTERFAWEADYAPGGGIATPTPTPVPVAPLMPSAMPTQVPPPKHTTTPSPTPTSTPQPTSTYVPMPTPSVERIAAVELAISALHQPQSQGDPRLVDNLRGLAAVSQPVFWTFLEQIGDQWMNAYHVMLFTSIAQIDEATALQIARMPFLGTVNQGADPSVIQQAAGLAKSDLPGLQQVLSHPTLHNGISDDNAMTFLLLVLGLEHPNAAAAIQALPWVKDGVDRPDFEHIFTLEEFATDHEQRAVLNLMDIARGSRPALMTLVNKPWLQDELTLSEQQVLLQFEVHSNSPLAPEIAAMPFLDTVERSDRAFLTLLDSLRYQNGWVQGNLRERIIQHPAFIGGFTDDDLSNVLLVGLELLSPESGSRLRGFPWVQDGLDLVEMMTVHELVEIASRMPDVVQALTQKSWVQDEMTSDKQRVISHFWNFTSDIGVSLASMPFLETLDDADIAAMVSLGNLAAYLGPENLGEVLSSPALRGGITDGNVGLVAVVENLKFHPELLEDLLSLEKTQIEERTIPHSHSGDIKLLVIRLNPGSSDTMDLLEHAVLHHQAFMLEPFPKRSLFLLVVDATGVIGEAFASGSITIESGLEESYSLIAHEVAHSYWGALPRWIGEGAATLLETVAENARYGTPIRPYGDGKCHVTDTITGLRQYVPGPGEDYPDYCHYSLGSALFLDLYHGLGDWAFRQGFRRLYVSIRDREHSEACDVPESGECIVRFAFEADASPEDAAIAAPILNRWFHGSEYVPQ